MMKNSEIIRQELANKKVQRTELAQRLGIAESTLFYRLRVGIPDEDVQGYLDKINEIAAEYAPGNTEVISTIDALRNIELAIRDLTASIDDLREVVGSNQ